jgi:predicted transcriptional regulator
MGKYKENPKHNVLSIRVSDAEKALMAELARHSRISITQLMREALRSYLPHPAALQQR